MLIMSPNLHPPVLQYNRFILTFKLTVVFLYIESDAVAKVVVLHHISLFINSLRSTMKILRDTLYNVKLTINT